MLSQSYTYDNYILFHSNYDFSQNNDCLDNSPLNKIIKNNLTTNTNIAQDVQDISESKTIKTFNHSFDEGSFELKSNNLSINYLKSSNINENKDLKKIKKENLKNQKKIKFVVRNDEKDNKIFSIKKKVKLGRIKRNSNKQGKHNKYYKDNIIRRFKVHLMNNIYDFINSSFKINEKFKKHKQIKFIRKLSSYEIKLISKKDNIKWLNSSIKTVFSQKISTKISTFHSDYNKKLIKSIYDDKKETKVINILDKTIREMWLIYINDINDEFFSGFAKLKDDIIKLRNMGETEYYINLFVDIAHKFEEIFENITPRK